jgi:hypothetical protein
MIGSNFSGAEPTGSVTRGIVWLFVETKPYVLTVFSVKGFDVSGVELLGSFTRDLV